jgi:glycosyltransferase involved in cell wall biosynthesis
MPHTISVVVPTRNRPDHIEPCVSSILRSAGDFELVVVDQSDDEASERALQPYTSDPRFRLVRSERRGASNARNLGIANTSCPLIAFTDDDCRVSQDWLSRMTDVFAEDEAVEIVFGRVSIPEHLQGKGFAADFEPHQRSYQGDFPPVDVAWGIGANMGVRRRLFERIGTFDLLLGPGAPFNAGEEFDLMIRALAAGSKVVNASEVCVEHLGVREGEAASRLMRGYGVSVGATLAKHVRLRTPRANALLLEWALHFGGAGVKNAIAGKRPTGLGLVAGMLRGVYLSWRRPIDRGHQVYR